MTAPKSIVERFVSCIMADITILCNHCIYFYVSVSLYKIQERTNLNEDDTEIGIEIIHGEPFTEKKSTFQAHIANVYHVDQVKKIVGRLLENSKVW